MSSHQEILRVAIIGAAGRMGLFADRWLSAQANFEVVDRIYSKDDLPKVLAASQAHVALDLTRASLGARHAKLILEAGLRPVIGTSGVDSMEDEALDQLARERGLGGLIVPNFSLGVCLQQKLSLLAAQAMGVVEIVEEHHLRKVDKPSATALDTAQRIHEVLPAGSAPVPIHSIRTLGVHSNQTVICTGPGEVLRIVHETYDLEAFGPGMCLAIQHVMGQIGMSRGLQHCL
ncbi:MAG: 4-hydroxy-tetrahydrodipicolinate reductase [Planctomycetes bacterium]|nr:4-hydroxy-tetrahydrodipicolinate reductase [Planctomycetota bacterium]